MIVYITKYALTKGIQERDVSDSQSGNSQVIYDESYNKHFFKPDWYTDKDDALFQAELMRFKKISSLSKQIKKIRNLQFEPKIENL